MGFHRQEIDELKGNFQRKLEVLEMEVQELT
jgi:hypothetical protein